MISKAERLEFVRGFQTLSRRGTLATFISAHSVGALGETRELNIHSTSQNFFWHSYFLWEFETEMRSVVAALCVCCCGIDRVHLVGSWAATWSASRCRIGT